MLRQKKIRSARDEFQRSSVFLTWKFVQRRMSTTKKNENLELQQRKNHERIFYLEKIRRRWSHLYWTFPWSLRSLLREKCVRKCVSDDWPFYTRNGFIFPFSVTFAYTQSVNKSVRPYAKTIGHARWAAAAKESWQMFSKHFSLSALQFLHIFSLRNVAICNWPDAQWNPLSKWHRKGMWWQYCI